MKKLLISILITLCFAVNSYAVPSASTVWEVRYDATAGNVNGGGFDAGVAVPGTDYSQQAAAQDYGTDLACADGDAATPLVTSVSHTFAEADEGNVIHITAGTSWTAGWYVITDTAAGVATLDRACGADGALTSGTWYYGGAMSLASTLDDDFFEQIADGNIVYIKYSASAYTLGETVSVLTNDATTELPIYWVGYNTTRTLINSDASKPTINPAATGISLGDYYVVRNISLTGTAVQTIIGGGFNVFSQCKIVNTSTTAGRYALNLGALNKAICCELQSDYGVALYASGNLQTAFGCYIHGGANSTTGISFGGDHNTIAFNIVSGYPTAAITIAATRDYNTIINNTLYGAETPAGIGLNMNDSEANLIANNIIYGFTTGINFSAEAKINRFMYNNLYNNTTARTNATAGIGDIALDPAFTNAATGDFTPGTNMKAVAFPGAFPGGTVTGYLDIGAVQRVEGAGGGATAYAF